MTYKEIIKVIFLILSETCQAIINASNRFKNSLLLKKVAL